jgi:thiosulfate sulfurtransferase
MDEKTKNQKALLFGFFLIILVILIFVFKDYFANKRNAKPDNPSITNQKNQPKLLSIKDTELSGMLLARKSPAILDIRDPLSFQAEHIIDSQNVSGDDLSNILADADKNKSYVIVDYTGENSVVNLPENLKNATNIFLLSGGFQGWKNNQNRTISRGDPNSFSDQSKVSYIKNDDLKKMIDEDAPNLYIIDARDSGFYSGGHIKNAMNIFLEDIEKRRKEIPLGKKIVVYGQDGLGGFQAAARLFDLGVMNVFAIPDGLNAWKEKGFEVIQ